MGCVDELSFGCESPKAESFNAVSDLIIGNAETIEKEIAEQMKKGYSYPKAREIVLLRYLDPHVVEGLSKPNNILAIEYRIALGKLGSKIACSPILRHGSDYNDEELSMITNSSATSIRNAIISSYDFSLDHDDGYIESRPYENPSTYMSITGEPVRQAMSEPLSVIRSHVPTTTYEILLEKFGRTYPLIYNNFSREVGYKLILEAENGFEDYLDVSRELSDKIIKNLGYFKSIDQFCNLLKTKDITYSRISRCMTHILLDIKKNTLPRETRPGYARILGFRKNSEELLGIIKENSSIPMISKLADASKYLPEDNMKMLEKDIQAAHIYDLVSACKYQYELMNEYTRQIIIV